MEQQPSQMPPQRTAAPQATYQSMSPYKWVMNENQFVTKAHPTGPTLTSKANLSSDAVSIENKLVGRASILTKVVPENVNASRKNISQLALQPAGPESLSSVSTLTDRTVRPYYTFSMGEISKVDAPSVLSEKESKIQNWVLPLTTSTTSRPTSKTQQWEHIQGPTPGQRGGLNTRNYYKDQARA